MSSQRRKNKETMGEQGGKSSKDMEEMVGIVFKFLHEAL